MARPGILAKEDLQQLLKKHQRLKELGTGVSHTGVMPRIRGSRVAVCLRTWAVHHFIVSMQSGRDWVICLFVCCCKLRKFEQLKCAVGI